MTTIDILGLLAGGCTTVSFIPQVIKTYKSKSAKDLSFGMFFTFWIGIILWMAYGLITGALPVIVANAMTFILASVILALKFKYKKD